MIPADEGTPFVRFYFRFAKGGVNIVDIAIIGGGASGLAAALAARESLDNAVTVFERQNRVGRKLLATGNGRCNLTNRGAGLDNYHGLDPAFAGPALYRFGPEQTLRWFASLGLVTRTESSGRVYPLSDTAGSVADVLRLALQARGGSIQCALPIVRAERDGDRFVLTGPLGESYSCDKLIVACGGMAGGRVGGVKDGYALLRAFSHTVTPLRPALVQLKTDNTWVRAMKGVRTQARLALERDGAVLASAAGEVQFTDYGLTGPAVYDLSRTASVDGEGCTVCMRLLPELDKVDIISYMSEKQSNFPDYKAENILSGALHNSIARVILRRAQIPQETRLWALSAGALSQIADCLCRFELPLTGTLGFEDAQVTAGGAATDQFDPETMASRLVPGLYACGEVLDVDGDCGGYNLQWAWSSGRLAGLAAGGLLEAAE